MKLNNTVVTLALLGVLALAALAGGLLPAGNTVHAADPDFVSGASNRSVPENTPPGVNIDDPISATDADETGTEAIEFGNTLTYKLGGTDAASFDIDPSTGQLITKAPLDFEADPSYSVTVTVDDGESRDSTCLSCTEEVTITVTDVDEEPAAPFPPTVVSSDDPDITDTDESTTRLKVVWHPPENMGRPDIRAYAVQFKESTGTNFGDTGVAIATFPATTATITGLKANTSYDVRVQARNDDGTGPWSLVGVGSTNKEDNNAPSFNEEDSLVELDVDENTPTGENVDSPVTATDQDTTTLTYDLGGPHADLFNFNTRSGQIRTKAPLNHEDARCGYVDGATPATQCIYRVTVTVVDGAGGSDATGVNIEVDDRDEAPLAPARPTVRATEKSSTSLDVSWNAPANTGPAITTYDVEYREGTDSFSANGVTVTGTTTATISGTDRNSGTDPLTPWLAANTSYEVRVRAKNGERDSAWSGTGTGRTNRANHQPIFDDRPGTGTGSERRSDYTISRTIDENPRSGHVVGRIFADDADNDRLTYKLVAADSPNEADVNKFTINETTGEIRTKAGVTYNYEDLEASGTCGTPRVEGVGSDDRCYTVKVEVRDGLDNDRVEDKDEAADDSITLKIGVRDRDEPPSKPTVTVTSPARDTTNDTTTLEVFWHARNSGPPITKYDVQYRKGGGTFSDDNCDTTGDNNCTGLDDDNNNDNLNTITTTTITGLDEDTSYSVQVRARNAEGTSGWSTMATLKTNKGANLPPSFADTTQEQRTRSVDENTPARRDVGSAVSASDVASDTWTYSLGGRDGALFNIVSSSGQIRTRAALNHEDPACGYVSTDQDTTCTYTVRVKADDRAGGSASIEVTISVTDEDEPPAAPSAPRMTATKDTGQSLDVSWNEPRNTGKPPITDYDIQYRKFKSSNPDPWQDWPHGTTADDEADNTDRSAKITRRAPADDAEPLEPVTQYEVRVRAKNGEGDSTQNWSSVAKASTGQSNSRPSFDRADSLLMLRVDENTRAGQNIGNAVSASDDDSNSLTYSLEGPGKDSFTIVSSSGQIRTRSPLDHETRKSYSVTVKVDDRQKRDNSIAAKSVTIMVDDVREAPSPPAAPRVAGIPGSTSSIRVTWDAPANTGPSITQYGVHYREVGSGPTRWDHFGADRSTIITGLKAGTRYEVQVRARSEEGTSDWSRWGAGSPNPDVANRNPTFSGASRSLSVAENTPPNTDVGAPIAATDRDGDTLTYTLEGADADSFDVLSTSDGGQIRTSAELNHEEKASYAVTVRVRDGRGGTDAANITIRVTDVDNEAPDTPFAPTVTAVSSSRLQVTWDRPANTGPPITDYDYRHREPGGSWTEVTNTTITATTLTIEGLAASTSYDVEVRAKNAEGTSDWSNPGIGATNARGANNPPVFDEGANTTRSVSASASAGSSIGQPVEATDADTDDSLTYGLEGRDAGLFDIDDALGQLLTRTGISLIAGETYTVIVTADDGTDISRITVEIEVTAGPPNNVPVFSEGASATRTVARSAAAGTAIGQPVRATDADAGTTLNYTLEGADAASFDINAANGQLLTRSGVTLDQSSYTVEVVASDGTASDRITVTINVVVNRAPVFSAGARSFTVRDNASAGTVIGSVTATDADDDTLTYSLEGTGAASFDIGSSSGQIVTRAGVTLTAGATHPVTVVATDGNAGRATVAVTITVVQGAFGCATRGAVTDASNTGLVADCEALLKARDQLQDGGARLNWFEGTPIDRWQGITLGGTPMRVTEVDLNRMGLSGTIPAELGDVRRLTKLNLRSNSLTGVVPASLGNLRYLEVLNLHSNMLNGEIPDLRRTVLQELYLTNNVRWNRDEDGERISRVQGTGLSGGVPAWLNTMTDLRELWLWGNNLEGTMPDLSRMRSLDKLKLSGNTGLTGFSGAKLPSGLRWLVASETDVGAAAPDLSGMTSMTTLWLNKTGLSGAIPVASIPTSVSNLNLKDNSLRTIPDMSDLDNLRYLYLHRNDLGGEIPGTLGDMASIERIWLHQNELTGIADGFRNASDTLTHLFLDGNSFDPGTCLPGDLADVLNNDFAAAGLAACQ